MKTCKGTLHIITRRRTSASGNPRWLISVDGNVCSTAPDSDLAYDIPNLNGKEVIADIGLHYGVETLKRVEKAQHEDEPPRCSW